MTKYSGMTRHLMAGTAAVAMLAGAPAVMTSSAVVAQDYTTGVIEGTVQDVSGATIAGATVTVVGNQGTSRSTTTNANGQFRIPRLPIGQYRVTVTSADHITLEDQSIVVRTGETVSPVFTLDTNDASIEELIVVGTAIADWDFNSTTGGLTIDVDDLVSNVPVGRDVTSLALLAPGTTAGDATFGNLASFSGASVAENVYYVNGLNISEYRNFLGSSTVPFDFIQQAEFKTSGYSAEFGRATGGVTNVVTKSGSNEFHFGANMYWTPNFLREKQEIIQNSLNHFEDRDTLDYNIWMSGPLIRDKLFFYGMYQWNERDFENYTTTTYQDGSQRTNFWGVKIDFEPFEGHRLEATLFSDAGETRSENYAFNGGRLRTFDGGTYRVPARGIREANPDNLIGAYTGATAVGKFGGMNEIYRYTGVWTDWMTISVMYGLNPRNNNTFTDPDTSNLPRIIDSRNGQGFFPVPGVSAATTTFGTSTDHREAFRVDADFYFDMAGEHHIRVGIDREEMESVNSTTVSGGQYWRYFTCEDEDVLSDGVSIGCIFPDGEVLNGATYVRDWLQEAGGSFRIIQTAQYIQDSWKVNDDLTLLLGLRNETFDNRNPNDETFIESKNQLALRLGFNWDPTGDGTSRVFGSFGRNYLPVAGNTNIRNSSAELFILNYYNTAGPDAQWNPIGVTKGEDVIWTRIFDDGELPNPATKAQIGLKPMYQDEWTLGYEKSFDNGWTGKVTGIRRDLKSIIEDIGVNHALAAWGAANGKDQADIDYLLDPSHPLEYIMANPGTDLTYLTDFYTHGEGLEEVTLSAEDLGYPKAKRFYTAVEFQMDREWDGKWMVNGSYTISWAKGNTEGSVNSDLGQDDAGLTQDFDLPATLIGADGYTANDRRHRFKVRGAYQLTDEVRVGGNFTFESGRKFGCFGNLPLDFSLDAAYGDNWDYHSQYGADYWFCDGEITPRGTVFKSPWVRRLDLSVHLTPSFNDDIPGEMEFSASIFNVFNEKTVTEYTFRKELTQTSAASALRQNFWYGQTSSRVAPRSIRLTARYKF